MFFNQLIEYKNKFRHKTILLYMSKKSIIIICLLTSFYSCTQTSMLNNFSDTPVEDLAIAVSRQDTVEIERLISKDKIDVNFMNSIDGNSVLMLSSINSWDVSVKKLVQLGANINLPNKLTGESAMSMICSSEYNIDCNPNLLMFFLDNGGDPNFVIKDIDSESNVYQTVLMSAVSNENVGNRNCMDLVELLIEKGADINAVSFNPESCAVNYAMIHENLEAVKLLLINHSAKIPKYAIIRFENSKDEEKVSLIGLLKEMDFSDDEIKSKLKIEIIDFLESKGFK